MVGLGHKFCVALVISFVLRVDLDYFLVPSGSTHGESLTNIPRPKVVKGDEAKEEMASNIVAVSNGVVSVPTMAMKVVGIATPLRTNDTIRKRVYRNSQKKVLAAKEDPQKIIGAAVSAAAAPAAAASVEDVSSLSGNSASRNSTSTSAQEASAR